MKYVIAAALLLASSLACAQSANTSLSNLGTTSINSDLIFATSGTNASHYLQCGPGDNLTLQTSQDSNGFGGGIDLTAGASIIANGATGVIVESGAGNDIDLMAGGNAVVSASSGYSAILAGDYVSLSSTYGAQLSNSGSQPACSSSYAGTLWYAPGGSGAADVLQVCMKLADDSYAWKTVSF